MIALPTIDRADRNGPHRAWFVSVMVGGDRFRRHVEDDSPAPAPAPVDDVAARVAACRDDCRDRRCIDGPPLCAP